ncbi:MAG: hypothetical protein ACE5HO_13845 [bacterium]
MKHRILVLALAASLLAVSLAFSQSRSSATAKGAALISGTASFSSQGGDLYGGGFNNDRFTTITIAPSFFHFVAPGLGLGGDVSLTYLSQGGSSLTNLGIGPKVGYFFDSGSNTIPFLAGGVNYLSFDLGGGSQGGLRAKLGAGILVRKDHLAISSEVAYLYDRFKPDGFSDSVTGNTIAIGVGFGGFVY